jgi:hypothetical protein
VSPGQRPHTHRKIKIGTVYHLIINSGVGNFALKL